MKTLKFNNKRAFTLIELLIVIAIIGILFIVLVSKVDFATDKAKTSGVQTDFRSFQLAFDTVATQYAGFDALVDTDYEALEAAINKHLDTSLKIDIDAMGKISMVNGTTDPWKVEYHGEVIFGEDGKDRGAIVIYSNGANMLFGSDITLTGGIASINVVNDSGKDDYGMVVVYSIVNSYGRVDVTTTGFSNNQSPENHNGNNVIVDDNNGNVDVPDVDPEVMAPVTLGDDKVIYVNNIDFEYYEVYFSVYRNDELIAIRNIYFDKKTLDVQDLMLHNGNYRVECEFLGELADDVRGHYTCESKYFKAWNVSDSVITMDIVLDLEDGWIYSHRYAFYEVRDGQNNVIGTFDDCNFFMISQLDTAKTYSIYKDSGEFIGYIIYE